MNKKILYLNPFIPEEIIALSGFEQWKELSPQSAKTIISPKMGECPFVKFLTDKMAEQIGISAAIITTTCDQMRRGHEYISSKTDIPVFLLNVPSTWQTQTAVELYAYELRRLSNFLFENGGKKIDETELTEYIIQKNSRKTCTYSDSNNGKIPVAVLGEEIIFNRKKYNEIIESGGAYIALDATSSGCLSSPVFSGESFIHHDPYKAIARAYLEGIHDISQRPNTGFHQAFRRKVIESKVSGVILHRYVWCDFWKAESQIIADNLQIPLLIIDFDEIFEIDSRIVNRIEAFIEMLKK